MEQRTSNTAELTTEQSIFYLDHSLFNNEINTHEMFYFIFNFTSKIKFFT